ncbi:MAG: sigma-70 family RNA polymerase sigma factor [Planctomycetes bacterium]|nr:sigma-70 family RNA polymerase sigma factor [Planctomycetota bacterium]
MAGDRECTGDSPDDAEALRCFVASRSEEAFRGIVERHGPMLLAACKRRLGHDAADAEDAVQSVFLTLAAKAPRLNVQGTLAPWLHGVSRYVVSTMRREARRRLEREREAARMDVGGEPDEGDAAGLWEEIRGGLDEAIDRLPARERDVVVLRFLQGKPWGEVGALLGAGEDAVRKRAQGALARLRRTLAPRGAPTALAPMALATLSACLTERSAQADGWTPYLASSVARSVIRAGAASAPAVGFMSRILSTITEGGRQMATMERNRAIALGLLVPLSTILISGTVVYMTAADADGDRLASLLAEAGTPAPNPAPDTAPRPAPDRAPAPDDTGTGAGPADPQPSPEDGSPAPERPAPGRIVDADLPAGLGIVRLRPLITCVAPGDDFQVLLRFEGPVLDGNNPMGTAAADIHVVIKNDQGREETFRTQYGVAVQPLCGNSGCRAYADRQIIPLISLHVPLTIREGAYVGNAGYMLACTLASPQGAGDFDAPGVYTIRIRGEIRREGADPVPFETGELAVERATASSETLPLAVVEHTAHMALIRYLQDRMATDPSDSRIPQALPEQIRELENAPPQPNRTIVENDAGNRLVRFGLPIPNAEAGGYRYEVEIRPDGTVVGFGGDRHGCIARGTHVETGRGSLPIEQVIVGDRAWGYDTATGNRVLTEVQRVWRTTAPETIRIGANLRVSANHPVYADGEWKPAGRIGPGDKLLGGDLRVFEAGPMETIPGKVDVFDLTVGEPHNFFAGGVLVHNKSRAPSPRLDDPWFALWDRPPQEEERR